MGPSAQSVADKQVTTDLVVQQIKSDLKNHLDGCAEGQKRIEGRFDTLDGRVTTMDGKLDGILRNQENRDAAEAAVAKAKAEMAAPKWWHPYAAWVVRGVIGGACVLIVALVTTVWKDEQQLSRVHQQAPTTVTVNPPASPVITPAPAPAYNPPTLPAPPAPDPE